MIRPVGIQARETLLTQAYLLRNVSLCGEDIA